MYVKVNVKVNVNVNVKQGLCQLPSRLFTSVSRHSLHIRSFTLSISRLFFCLRLVNMSLVTAVTMEHSNSLPYLALTWSGQFSHTFIPLGGQCNDGCSTFLGVHIFCSSCSWWPM